MLSTIFHRHGHLCASHPVEVIVCTITVTICFLSFGLLSHSDMVCGWNYDCIEEEKSKSPAGSDIIIFSIIKCTAVIYTYLQFRNLRKHGTKFMIGISGFLSVLPSFVFSIAIIKIFGNDISGVKEVLPFFFLLIDLSKACALANFALSSSNQKEVQDNVARGVSVIGPALTLDTLAEVLVISVGTLSDVAQLETTCYYGCLSVIANYLAFIILYPASLALFLEVARKQGKGQALKQLQRLAKFLNKEEKDQQPNLVTQNIKIIMSAGLMFVHIHSRLIAERKTRFGEILAGHSILNQQYREPDISLWHFYLQRFFTVRADSTFTLVLAVFLVMKYLFFDDDITVLEIHRFLEKDKDEMKLSDSCRRVSFITDNGSISMTDKVSTAGTLKKEETEIISNETSKVQKIFTLGEDSDDSDEDTQCQMYNTISTQTEESQCHSQQILPSTSMTSLSQPSVTRLSQPSVRSMKECIQILNSEEGPARLTDLEVIKLVNAKYIPQYKLESVLGDQERGVNIRRQLVISTLVSPSSIDSLPFENYTSYDLVNGACCENVIGYMPIPVGFAGPLLLDDEKYHVPMATTEGCLVASTNRGCRLLQQSGGVHSMVLGDGMSRAPVVRLPSASRACKVKFWLENNANYIQVKKTFDETSRFARLQHLTIAQAGRLLYIRFIAKTGDAMGMNMLSKGAEAALSVVLSEFPDLEILSLSGNYCTDKKPAAINWIEGRGKSVVCEATIPGNIVKNVLKTTVSSMVELNTSKNLVGSALAGSIGGYNAHAANIVTAIFLATGQDPAQCVTSCNCITLMECTGENNEDLYVSCTMPSIEVGTVGGGTILPPQAACLKMLGIQGSCDELPGDNARCLARIVCATVLAGELSLMGALAAGHLVRSHMKHNRSSVNINTSCSKGSSSIKSMTDSLSVPVGESSCQENLGEQRCDVTVLKHSSVDFKDNTNSELSSPSIINSASQESSDLELSKMSNCKS